MKEENRKYICGLDKELLQRIGHFLECSCEKENPPCGNCHKNHEGRTLCRKEDLTPIDK